MTSGTYSLVVFIWNVAPVVDIAGWAGVGGLAAKLAAIAGIHNISEMTQCFDLDKSSVILQLIQGKSRDL